MEGQRLVLARYEKINLSLAQRRGFNLKEETQTRRSSSTVNKKRTMMTRFRNFFRKNKKKTLAFDVPLEEFNNAP